GVPARGDRDPAYCVLERERYCAALDVIEHAEGRQERLAELAGGGPRKRHRIPGAVFAAVLVSVEQVPRLLKREERHRQGVAEQRFRKLTHTQKFLPDAAKLHVRKTGLRRQTPLARSVSNRKSSLRPHDCWGCLKMREFTKSMGSFFLACSLFGLKQAENIL